MERKIITCDNPDCKRELTDSEHRQFLAIYQAYIQAPNNAALQHPANPVQVAVEQFCGRCYGQACLYWNQKAEAIRWNLAEFFKPKSPGEDRPAGADRQQEAKQPS